MTFIAAIIAGAAVVGGAAISADAQKDATKAASRAAGNAQFRPLNLRTAGGDVRAYGNPETGRFEGYELGYDENSTDGYQTWRDFLQIGGKEQLYRSTRGTGFEGLDPRLLQAYQSADSALARQGQVDPFFATGGAGRFRSNADQALGFSNQAGASLQNEFQDPTLTKAATRFVGAGQDALGALGSFNLDQATSTELARLDALAAPGERTQTQGLFDRLQSTGRLGLTQNAELGDIGGLQLAQQSARNDRLGLARQSALSQRSQLAGEAAQFSGIGTGLMSTRSGLLDSAVARFGNTSDLSRQADMFGFDRLLNANNLSSQSALSRFGLANEAFNVGTNARQAEQARALGYLGGLQSLDQGQLALLNTSIAASSAQSGAGAAAGALTTGAANNNANATGSLVAGLFGGLAQSGAFTPKTAPATKPGG
jgi:hypothetical protein